MLKRQYDTFGYIPGEDLTTQFNRYICLVSELKSVEVELENDDVVKQFMTSLAHKCKLVGAALIAPVIENISDSKVCSQANHHLFQAVAPASKPAAKVKDDKASTSDDNLNSEKDLFY
ncbi:hypothetical protein L1987_08981 [Smallanthus sonchifolius]|uniref:Uncharacterized protein n=1 Tax=Smallanthus sonchifolius TaxID=185202 RepID=A0ACB9JN95_9ASTR|nr:hypothetical protein L1987_08981 [Smallanthus sonchifolius]